MIEKKYLQKWKANAPWAQESQVEQDLIISRVLCELYSDQKIRETLAFRGGTSLQKLFFKYPKRYSEDIDLVQIPKETIGKVVDQIKSRIDPWLGKAQVSFKTGRVTMRYKYDSSEEPVQKMKLKIEINNAEHFTTLGYVKRPFAMQSDWYSGQCELTTYTIEEILATKLRALYQRKKGRDLYDFACAFEEYPSLDCDKVIQCFLEYMKYGSHRVTRAEFEIALDEKKHDLDFITDIIPLLSIESDSFDPIPAFNNIEKRLITLLPGESWKCLNINAKK